MDSLIAIGSSAAAVYGIYAIYKIGIGMGHSDMELVHTFMMDLYFESAGMILTLITLGKALEARVKGKTSDAITKLTNWLPRLPPWNAMVSSFRSRWRMCSWEMC